MLREIKIAQRLPRMLAVRLNGTGTAAILEGGSDVSITDNGTGDYTLTILRPFKRKPVIVATCATADCYAETVDADNSVSSIHLLTKNNADAATDAIVHLMILGFDAADAV